MVSGGKIGHREMDSLCPLQIHQLTFHIRKSNHILPRVSWGYSSLKYARISSCTFMYSGSSILVQHSCLFPLILFSLSKMMLSIGQSHFSSQISKTEAVPSHSLRMIRYFSVILTSFWIAANSIAPSFFCSFSIKRPEERGPCSL